jgi:DNA-binding response OmpR family regulator
VAEDPYPPVPRSRTPPREAEASLLPGRHRVLLVDDEPQLRSTLERTLIFHCFEVQTADCGEAAQAALMNGGIDLLLTDVSLGGAMDGFQLAFWARDRLPCLPMVLISGLALFAPPLALKADAAVWLLPKPFSAIDLIAILRNALLATSGATV